MMMMRVFYLILMIRLKELWSLCCDLLCVLLQVCVVNSDEDEDSESPLASRKTSRSKKRRVKDLSVCVFTVFTVYSDVHLNLLPLVIV